MKTLIEVADREEARLIKAGLGDHQVRAFVKVMGALQRVPTDRGKRRILDFVADHFAEFHDNDSRVATHTPPKEENHD